MAGNALAQFADRYALILRDSPAAAAVSSRGGLQSPQALSSRARIEAAHASLKSQLAARHFVVTGSASTLLNAVFVAAAPDRVRELRSLPGVVGVVRLHRYKRTLNTAVQLMNAPAAWSLLGGFPVSGAGIKIAVIDSGIDQNHPSLRDPGLTVPAGFPKCGVPSDCIAFTNSKVIVARSYVRQLALGTGVIDPATSRADDYSARDRSGHGTAVATSAAGNTSTGSVPINGMAPKAWLGSYKVFGSPQVNDFSTDDVLVAALEDALADGMDIVSMSIGGAAFTGPLDTGAACGEAEGVPCDIAATAFEALANKGVLIVVAAGNEGANGIAFPTFGSIASPADAPSVLSVGASSNSHTFTPGVRITGAAVPADLSLVPAHLTNAGLPYSAYSAPLVDAGTLAADDYACSSFPADSLKNAFAFIQRGGANCTFALKMTNAVNAGAAGVIFYDRPDSTDFPFTPSGLTSFYQPVVLLSNADGIRIKGYLAAHPGVGAIIDPASFEVPLSSSLNNQVVYYSSLGPALGTGAIKPDVLAVGGGGANGDLIYMGAQSYDPLGDVYSATGYIAAAGTSFATPLTAGAAALVKQAHPGYSAAQLKSALVNTATQDVVKDDSGLAVSILQTGAGKIAADLAIQSNVTIEPASLSFGQSSGTTLAKSIPIRLTNTGVIPATLSLTVLPQGTASPAAVTLDRSQLTIAPGETSTVTAALTGPTPAAGLYYGAIAVSGASVPLRIAYMHVVGSSATANFIVLAGGGDGTVNQPIPQEIIAFQVTDANGVPVPGAAVTFAVASGSVPVRLSSVSSITDAYGIASASVKLGDQPGRWVVNGCLGTCGSRNRFQSSFGGNARLAPAISAGGIVDAASSTPKTTLAPGSYFSIYGAQLSDSTATAPAAGLPLAIDDVNVSFDVPSAGISAPARLVFVSGGQINAQVPWELQGQTAAQVKVSVGETYSNVVTVPIAAYAPAFFENPLGSGLVAAIDPARVSGVIITGSSPAARGSVIAIYVNGLGPVENQPATGDVASASVLSRTTTLPVVTIGGRPANVSYSGLTPGLPGLYQINVTVPADIGPGTQPITLSIGEQNARALSIPVQ